MSARVLVCAVAVLICGKSSVHAGSFFGVGDLPGAQIGSTITDVSRDGRYVTGMSATRPDHNDSTGGGQVFRWSVSGGIQDIGIPTSGLAAGGAFSGPSISADGSTIAGTFFASFIGFRWTESGGFQPIPNSFIVNDLDASGTRLVGGRMVSGVLRATVYDASDNFQGQVLTTLATNTSLAVGITGDGTTIGGFDETAGEYKNFRIRDGFPIEQIQASATNQGNYIRDISDDSNAIAGRNFVWREGSGIEDLTDIITPYNFSPDGSVILGRQNSRAAIYYSNGQLVFADDLLTNNYGIDLTGWKLTEAVQMSADGTVIAGNGINPNGNREGWVAVVPEPSTIIILAGAIFSIAFYRRR